MSQQQAHRPAAAQRISLQVPENVNLIEMSNDEIEKLALELAQKTASALPQRSTLLGIDRIALTNSARPEVGVWGEWSRACFAAELDREGLVVNPEIFRSPIESGLASTPSTKVVIKAEQKIS